MAFRLPSHPAAWWTQGSKRRATLSTSFRERRSIRGDGFAG
jgi:hypothetical protein